MTENSKKLIEYRFEQARETLEVARELFGCGHYREFVVITKEQVKEVIDNAEDFIKESKAVFEQIINNNNQ